MKKTAATILAGLGAGYIIALIWELIKGQGMIVMEATKARPMEHLTFLTILFWCLASIYAAYHLYQAKDD